MSKFRPSSSLLIIGASLSLFAVSAEAKDTRINVITKSAVYKKLSKKVSTKRKSLLFDQEFDKTPVRPLISDALIKKIIEIDYAHKKAASVIAQKALETPKASTPVAKAEPQREPATVVEKLEEKIAEVTPAIVKPAVVAKAEAPEVKVQKQVMAFINKPTPKTAVAPEKPKKEVEPKKPTPFKAAASEEVVVPKNLEVRRASVMVLDEENFAHGKKITIEGAKVFWLHPDASLSSQVKDSGIVKVPYPKAVSTRFVVMADGYLPAVGYAVKGQVTPILLYKEKRLPPILESLHIHPNSSESILIGRFLDRELNPVKNVEFETFESQHRKSYFSVGAFGLFHEAAKESGPQGDFLFKGLDHALQYLLASKNNDDHTIAEWPAQILDLKGLGPVLTTTVVASEAHTLETQIVDAFTLVKPDSGIYASIGGQRGLTEPDENGFLKFTDLFKRPNVDLVEINAQGYLKTWLNTPVAKGALPEVVPLFTPGQANEILSPSGESVGRNDTLIVGTLRPEIFNFRSKIWVYDSRGNRVQSARAHYFGNDGRLSPNANDIDPGDARFIVTGLEDGEYHLVLLNAESGVGQSIQVVRVAEGVVSQVQF